MVANSMLQSSMTADDDFSYSTNKLVRRAPCSRSLVFYTPTKEDQNKEIDVFLDDDILDVLSSPRAMGMLYKHYLLVCVIKRKYFFILFHRKSLFFL